MAAFVVSQRRAADPLLPPRIFTGHRNFPLACAMILVTGVVMFGCALYLPLFQQTVQGASAANSGLLLLPMMVPVVLVSQIGGRVMSATGRYKAFPVAGAACMTAGLLLLSTMDVNTSRTATSCFMVLVGAGLGCMMQMVTTIAQNSVGTRGLGAASASVNLFRTVGGSLGVAVFGSLFARAVRHHPVPGAGAAAASGGTRPGADDLRRAGAAARDGYLHGVATGTHGIFLTAAAACAAAFVCALAVREVPLRGKPAAAQAGGPAAAAGPAPEQPAGSMSPR